MVKKQTKKAVSKPVKEECCSKMGSCGDAKHGMYCLGFIGALIYYISTATGFWVGVLGVLKAIVWPVFLVYGILKFIGA